MLRLLAGLFLGIVASSAGAQPLDAPLDLRRAADEAHAACPSAAPLPLDSGQLLHQARRHAGSAQAGPLCPAQPALAIRIAEALAAEPSPASAEAMQLLADLYARGIGVPADPARAAAWRRRYWLIADRPYGDSPFADDAELTAFLTEATTIDFLARFAASQRALSARLQLARALLARGRPADRLWALGLLYDPPLRGHAEAMFLRGRALIASADPAERREGMATLYGVGRFGDSRARQLLREAALSELAEAGAPNDRWNAIAFLGLLASDGPREFDELIRAVIEENDGRPPRVLEGEAAEPFARALAPRLSSDDYPPAAVRNEEEGVVRLRGLIDPRGRVIYTEEAAPNQNPRLVSAVRAIYSRRTVVADLREARTGLYMWVDLPPITFDLADP